MLNVLQILLHLSRRQTRFAVLVAAIFFTSLVAVRVNERLRTAVTSTTKLAVASQWAKLERHMGFGYDYDAGEDDEEVDLIDAVLTPPPQKITIIAIWSTMSHQDPFYLENFFTSVKHNPSITLLFIVIDKVGNGCHSYTDAENVKVVCLPVKEYFDLHLDFLCDKQWDCSGGERERMHEYLMKQMKEDRNFSFFRILRAGIFKKYVDPKTTLWGWCDMDVYWGNFERVLPWDILHEFEVIAIGTQPTHNEQNLIFTRGHLAFFRFSDELDKKMLRYSAYGSPQAYRDAFFRWEMEEGEFSHFYFMQYDDFTFILLEGMVSSYDTVFVSYTGIYYTPASLTRQTFADNPALRHSYVALVKGEGREPVRPTFTPEGREEEMVLKNSGYRLGLWFPEKYVVLAEPGWSFWEMREKGYFMRRTPGGPVTKRLEPRRRYVQYVDDMMVDEALYIHYQSEKHLPFYKELVYDKPMQIGDVYVQWKTREGEVWDSDANVLRVSPQDIIQGN